MLRDDAGVVARGGRGRARQPILQRGALGVPVGGERQQMTAAPAIVRQPHVGLIARVMTPQHVERVEAEIAEGERRAPAVELRRVRRIGDEVR